MVLRGVGWDKKKFLESNLHVYGGDDIKVVVYNMGRWPKKSREEKTKKFGNDTFNSYNIVHKQDLITQFLRPC